MNEKNKENRISKPKLIKERLTGKWKVCFEYVNDAGKRKRYYYSNGLNDSSFFQFDSNGNIKVDGNGAILLNVKQRNELANKRIARLNRDLDDYIFDINKGVFILGDKDRKLTDLMQEFITFKSNEGTVNANTIRQYKSKLNGIKNYFNKNNLEYIRLKEFTKEHLKDFYSYLLNELNFTKTYRDDYNRFFVAVYNYLINFKDLDITNITKSFKNISKGKTKLHSAIEAKHLDTVVHEIQECNYHLGLLFKFIFFTLHRIETLTQVQFKYINLEDGTMYLPSDIMKNNEEVTISIAQPIKDIIINYLKENEVNANDYLFGRDSNNVISLFGQHMSKANTFSSQFSSFKSKKLNGDTPTFVNEYSTLYSAKHSGIKFLLDSGLNLNQIISITGHRSTDQLGTYAKDYRAKKVQFPTMPIQE